MNESISVKCPECSNEFSLSEAVLSSVREGVAREIQAGLSNREKELARRQKEVEQQQAEIKKKANEIEGQVEQLTEQRVKNEIEEIKSKVAKKAEETYASALKELKEELHEKTNAMKELQAVELALRKEKRQVEEAKDALQLEVQRKLDEERGKLKQQAKAQSDEENRLKIAEKEKVITDLKVKLDEAQRKAEQGSQQTQGEVLEIDFEAQLRGAFPFDVINEVSKGVRGADVFQEVRTNTGRTCGIILYENKRTKNWSDGWIAKLKTDMLNVKADIGVIVTEVLPPNVDTFCQRDGTWVTDLKSAIPLAHVLRCVLQEVGIAKGHREGAKEKMELLYAYLTGNEFRQRVSAVIDAFKSMRSDLETERRTLTRQWSKREKHINSVVENMAGMVGDVQAISGNALKDIPALELEDSDETE